MSPNYFKGFFAIAFILLTGALAYVFYSSWQYKGDVFVFTQKMFEKDCKTQSEEIANQVIQGSKTVDKYSSTYFSCMSARASVLTHKLQMSGASYKYLACMQEAGGNSKSEGECKNVLEGELKRLGQQTTN